MPAQSVSDGYALVETGGLAHVRILANNVVVGRTNNAGLLIVPGLGSYLNNEISIQSSDTPLDYQIDEQTQHVSPLYRSGTVVRFGINRVRPVLGTLRVRLGSVTIVPAYGILEVDLNSSTITSDIGDDGAFYFENLPEGVHHAMTRFHGGECRFDLSIPKGTAAFTKLGTVLCTNGVRT